MTALDDLELPALKDWLRAALHGHRPLPRLTPDEHPYIGVTRLVPDLRPSTVHRLEDACRELTRAAVQAPNAEDPDYIDNLLRLIVALRLDDLAKDLAGLAEQTELPDDLRRRSLAALIDLHAPQPAPFWQRLFARLDDGLTDPRLMVTMFSGLLQSSLDDALAHLSALPDDPLVADSIVSAFDALQSALGEPARTDLMYRLRAALPACRPALRASFAEWLPASPGQAASRDYSRLDAVFTRMFGEFNPIPRTARL